ncbi:Rossmann-like domain-containing protein, partial [[Eubacterium] cellulosolvens]
PEINRLNIKKACIGLGYTGVTLESGHAGLCHTLSHEMSPYCCQVNKRAGKIAGSGAIDIANMARSWDVNESVLGFATLNALSQKFLDEVKPAFDIRSSNFIDELRVKSSDTVVMVGSLHPFIKPIREKAKELYIIERSPLLREEGTFPDTAAEDLLPQADVVVATGSSLANGTIDRILELSNGTREFALVGPSANVIPNPLFDRGVTAIGGVKILDGDRMIQIIAEGGGTPQLKPITEFITIRPTT